MASVNRVIIIGNVGKDPEMRNTRSGAAVTSFSVATHSRRLNEEGQREDATEWHNVVAFGQLAESCCRYLHKGAKAYVEGRLRTRQYRDGQGHARRITEIVAVRVGFLDPISGSSQISQDGTQDP